MNYTQKYNLVKTAGILEELAANFENLSDEEKQAILAGLGGAGIGGIGGALSGDGVMSSLGRGAAGAVAGGGLGYGGAKGYDAYQDSQRPSFAEGAARQIAENSVPGQVVSLFQDAMKNNK